MIFFAASASACNSTAAIRLNGCAEKRRLPMKVTVLDDYQHAIATPRRPGSSKKRQIFTEKFAIAVRGERHAIIPSERFSAALLSDFLN